MSFVFNETAPFSILFFKRTVNQNLRYGSSGFLEAVAPPFRDPTNLLQYHHDGLFSIRLLPLVYIQFTIIESHFLIRNKM